MFWAHLSPRARVLHVWAWDQQQQHCLGCIRNASSQAHPAAAAAKSLQSCPTLCDPIDGQPIRLHHPWDSPGRNTGVGCHFLLQCMKVESESEVAQSCLTLSHPTDCSLPGFSVHGIFQARVLEWGAIAFCRPMESETLDMGTSSLCVNIHFWWF